MVALEIMPLGTTLGLILMTMESERRLAIVTGGNRGIGLEVCRQLADGGVRVILAARDDGAGSDAAAKLARKGVDVTFRQLDVSESKSIAAFTDQVREQEPRIDILVNNAGITLKGFNADVVKQTLAVNFFGAMHLTDALLPLMSPTGRIAMVSSSLGALSCLSSDRQAELLDPGLTRDRLVALVDEFYRDVEQGRYRAQGWPKSAYAVSKVALNALTRILAKELEGSGMLVNAISPGWVRTRMGGRFAARSVAKGADTIVWAATLPPDGPQGAFLHDRKPIQW